MKANMNINISKRHTQVANMKTQLNWLLLLCGTVASEQSKSTKPTQLSA